MEQIGKQCTCSNNETQWENKNIYSIAELKNKNTKRNNKTDDSMLMQIDIER